MKKTLKQLLDREFSEAERAAIGECIKAAELMMDQNGVPHSEMHKMMGALFLERAASIMRQESVPFVPDMDYLRAFAKFWNIRKRAKFNEGS